jgi:site-specific DNA recombinase
VNIVITKDLSRLGRDYLATGYYIEHYFPLYDIRYIAIDDQVDTDKNDNEFAPFKNIMNEWYAKDISKKIRSAYRTKALNGEFTGSYAPYGYHKNPKEKHQLVISPYKAQVVKTIFNFYLESMSIYQISKMLKNKKILTPRADLYKHYGIYESIHTTNFPYEWDAQTIMNILLNEVYIGTIIWNKYQTKTFKTKQLKQNPKNEWIISRHKHEPIIDDFTFQKVQDLMRNNKRLHKTTHTNILKGKVRCNECGKTLSLSMRNDRKVYGSFSCGTYRRYGKERCSSHYITYDYLVENIRLSINKIIKHSKQNETEFKINILNNSSLLTRKEKLENNLNRNQDRIKVINILVKKLFEKYLNEKIIEDKYYELDKSYDEEKLYIIEELKKIEGNLQILNQQLKNISFFYESISKYEEITELNLEDIKKWIDKIVIHEQKGKDDNRLVDVYYVLIGKI